MTHAQHKYRYRSRKRLKEIVANWKRLSKNERTTKTLLLATDAAHLDRTFVAEELTLDLSTELAAAPSDAEE